MARSSEDIPILAGSGSPLGLVPFRRSAGLRVASFAVLLLRAIAIVLLVSPAFVAATLLFG